MYPFFYDFPGLFTRIIPVVGFKIYGSYNLLRSFFSRRRFIFDNRDFSRGCGFFSANFLIFLGAFLCGHTFLGYYVGILHCLLGNFCGTVAIVLFKEKYKRSGYSGGADSHGGVNPPPVASRGADGRFVRLMHAWRLRCRGLLIGGALLGRYHIAMSVNGLWEREGIPLGQS